MVKEFQR